MMNRKLMALLTMVLVFAGISKTVAQKLENSVFWEISGKGIKKPSYLFGTYHIVSESYLNDVPNVKKAFENCDAVTVEMVIDSAKLLTSQMMAMMPGKKISELVTKEDFELVSAEVQAVVGADLKALDQLKPVVISTILTLMYLKEDENSIDKKYTGLPLDVYFAETGKSVGKTVHAFETMEEQMKILYDGQSYEKQAEQLVSFVKEKEEMKVAQRKLTQDYFDGNLNAMYAMTEQYAEQTGDMTYMLDDRNVRWMENIPTLLNEENQFIAVGALHLAGKKGLIQMLREAGYKVKPLALK